MECDACGADANVSPTGSGLCGSAPTLYLACLFLRLALTPTNTRNRRALTPKPMPQTVPQLLSPVFGVVPPLPPVVGVVPPLPPVVGVVTPPPALVDLDLIHI